MDILRKLFPLSFREMEVKDLVISILIYIALSVVVGIVCAILGFIPILGIILNVIIGFVSSVYVVVGIIMACLVFAKVVE